MSKRAFSIIEMLVVIALIAILSAVATISFSITRRNSRDSRRKTDVQQLSAALTQYASAVGTTFIVDKKQTCALSSQTDPSIPGIGAGCVGASGRAYGKVNLISATSSGYPTATNAGRTYAPVSIGTALLDEGYLSAVPRDPFAVSKTFDDPNDRDYVLIRACSVTGEQQVGNRGTVFAFWASLEGTPTTEQMANSDRYAGGRTAGLGPDANGNVYIYDFAAQQAEWNAGAYYLNGFAAGNSATKTVSAAPCDSPQKTS